MLAAGGVYSHLITDHFHYFEDGGATYHNRYDSYEFVRGQEGDAWKAMVQPHWERLREMYHERQYSEEQRDYFRHNMVNREFIREETDLKLGLEADFRPVQAALRHRLERTHPRLAALWARGRASAGVRGAPRQLLCGDVAVRLPPRTAA